MLKKKNNVKMKDFNNISFLLKFNIDMTSLVV